MSVKYRKRGSGFVRCSLSLSPETAQGLERIRSLFLSQFKTTRNLPAHSAIVDSVLGQWAARLEADPAQLAVEVADFERRYLTKKGK